MILTYCKGSDNLPSACMIIASLLVKIGNLV
jgi:hypothetical protein